MVVGTVEHPVVGRECPEAVGSSSMKDQCGVLQWHCKGQCPKQVVLLRDLYCALFPCSCPDLDP